MKKNAKKLTELQKDTRSSEKQKTKPPTRQKNKRETKPEGEETATATAPAQSKEEEERQEYGQHEPDTLEKAIAGLMDQEDQKRAKQQNQEQRKKTTHGITGTGAETPEAGTATAKTEMTTKKTREMTSQGIKRTQPEPDPNQQEIGKKKQKHAHHEPDTLEKK